MAALTGSERGLPVGSFLNDTVEAGPDTLQVSVVWQPFEDEASLVKHHCFCRRYSYKTLFLRRPLVLRSGEESQELLACGVLDGGLSYPVHIIPHT